MTDFKLIEAAEKYSLLHNKTIYDVGVIEPKCVDAFIAGAEYEKERSKKLLEALKACRSQGLSHYEECSYMWGEEDDCNCGADTFEQLIHDYIKEYEGVK